MNAHTLRCGLSLFVIVGVVVIPWTKTREHHTFLFVVWLQKDSMDKEYIIFQEDGLFGAKNQRGEVVIPPQYNWFDPQFICGFARVMKFSYIEEKNQWGIIDTLGNIVVPLKYDKIWAIKEEYLFSLKAFLGDKEERINLHQLGYKVIFDGLTYICTYSVEAFKELVHCKKLYVKVQPNTRQLYFTFGANIGFVSLKGMPKKPVISIVANSSGKIFPLLMEKSDIGKATLSPAKAAPKKIISRTTSHQTSFWEYESEKMDDTDNWSAPYGDEQAYYGGWSREDIESGLADSYEGDINARWNND